MKFTKLSDIGRGGFGRVEQVENEYGATFAKKYLIPPLTFRLAPTTN